MYTTDPACKNVIGHCRVKVQATGKSAQKFEVAALCVCAFLAIQALVISAQLRYAFLRQQLTRKLLAKCARKSFQPECFVVSLFAQRENSHTKLNAF
jgi:hypothetical protein